MDITVQRDDLLKPLQAVSGVVEKKQTLPILSNVLLTTKDQQLLLTGTDLEVELIGFVPVVYKKADGSTTVSARKLFDICRTLPDNSVLHLSIEKNNLVIRTGESYFMLNILPPQDFPNLEACTYAAQLVIKQGDFKNLLTKTYFAMGQQDVRNYLNGTFLDITPHAIKSIAADGHRLALATIEQENMSEVEAKVIIPRKSVMELIRLLQESEEPVTIQIAESRFRATTHDYVFTSKLISAQYPDYNRLIPKGKTVAIGDREQIKQALTRAAILSNEKFRSVRFQLEPSKLLISANNADQEQAEESVSLQYDGQQIEMGFNVAYLLDVVSAITAKTIRCIFTGPNDGVLIEAAESNEGLYVIMPMRL